MIDIKKLLKDLTLSTGIGHITETREKIRDYLGCISKTENVGSYSLLATIDAKKEQTLLIEAHMDEVGMIVTDIKDNGFVTVSAVGGIDLRQLPAKELIIHAKEDIPAVVISTPPHLSKGNEKFDDISKLKLDTGLFEKAKEIISLGDIVTYKGEFTSLSEKRVCSKAIDNRALCAVLIILTEKLQEKNLPFNIKLLFTDGEELGHRGVKTALFGIDCDEAIVTDVTFADAPDVPANECGKMGKGPMIGVSPILDKNMTSKLVSLAKEKDIPFQYEIMTRNTGTDADDLSLCRNGIKCSLLSVPIRNMHTDCEIVDIDDINSTVNLLEEYILSGGAYND